MGIHDRDYYRKDYARKNGMRYNERNATYSKLPVRPIVERRASNEIGLVAKILVSLAVAVVCAVVWRYFR